jgi:hypothetical protein
LADSVKTGQEVHSGGFANILASLISNSLRRVRRACPTTGGKAPAFQILFEY